MSAKFPMWLGQDLTQLTFQKNCAMYSTGCDKGESDDDDFATEADTMINIVYEDDLDVD